MFETKSGICDLYDKSRMKREFHVRFCERLGLKCPCLLDYTREHWRRNDV